MEYIPAIIAATTPTVVAARITTQLSSASSLHGRLTRKRGIAHVIESRNWHVSVGYNEPAANYTLDHSTPRFYASSAFYGAVHRRRMNRECVRKRSTKCYGYSVETRSLKNSIIDNLFSNIIEISSAYYAAIFRMSLYYYPYKSLMFIIFSSFAIIYYSIEMSYKINTDYLI